MLRLSTKTRYALRTMIELAKHEGEGMVPLKEVAEAQQLSPKYLEQLAISLRHAGLVLAERGSQGGYVLSRPATEISALQIVQAVDGPLQLVSCVSRPATCDRMSECSAHMLWAKLTDVIEGVLTTTTLADLASNQQAARMLRIG